MALGGHCRDFILTKYLNTDESVKLMIYIDLNLTAGAMSRQTLFFKIWKGFGEGGFRETSGERHYMIR